MQEYLDAVGSQSAVWWWYERALGKQSVHGTNYTERKD